MSIEQAYAVAGLVNLGFFILGWLFGRRGKKKS